MKNLYIILCIVLFGCNSSNNEKSLSDFELDDTSVENVENHEEIFKKPNFSQLSLIEEKLQETYDLVYLLEKNSDFESSNKVSSIILPQLILDSLDTQDSITINDLTQIGIVEIINDSISHLNFSYKIKINNTEKTDTLKAIIEKQDITIEGLTTTSIKVDFTKENN